MIIQCVIICSHVLSLFRDLFVTANVKGFKGVQYFDLHRGPIPLTFDAPKRIPPSFVAVCFLLIGRVCFGMPKIQGLLHYMYQHDLFRSISKRKPMGLGIDIEL